MVTLDQVRKPVAAELEAFEGFVAQHFRAEGELLGEMLQYALASRGKGIRPAIVMLSAAMNGRGAGSVGRRTQLAALLIEMIHVASLIHDDVIDEADSRRGRPSVNARWQSHRAVILGDYILGQTFAIGMRSGQFDLVSHICEMVPRLCEGEVLQSDCADRRVMTRSRYLEIIRGKTASLIGVSASAGALSAGAPAERVAEMRRFGEALGMAFQIRDDMLDYTSTDKIGKPAGNDLREGKITLPLLAVFEQSTPERQAELTALLKACATDEAAVAELRSTVEREGGLVYAAGTMAEYLRRAVQLLAGMPASPFRDALTDLCTYVGQRER